MLKSWRYSPQGETCKRGYAVNYLIPQGLATIATDHHKRMIEKHKAQLLELEKDRIEKLKGLAAELQDKEINIESNASDTGKLYGSVTATDIVAALRGKGYHLSVEQICLEGPLKEIGMYKIKVRLTTDVETEIKIWVVPPVAVEA